MSGITRAGTADVETLLPVEYTADMTRGGIAALLVLGALGCGAPPPPAPVALTAPEGETAAPAATKSASPTADTSAEEELPPLAGFGMTQELEDVTFRQTRGTATQWELHAARVREEGDAPAHLEGVTLRYFGDDTEPTLITAAEAEYDVRSKSAMLRGNVRIKTPTGDSLESEELFWDADAQMLNTEVEVTLRRGGSFITGTGLKTSPGLQDVELFQVRGVFRDNALSG